MTLENYSPLKRVEQNKQWNRDSQSRFKPGTDGERKRACKKVVYSCLFSAFHMSNNRLNGHFYVIFSTYYFSLQSINLGTLHEKIAKSTRWSILLIFLNRSHRKVHKSYSVDVRSFLMLSDLKGLFAYLSSNYLFLIFRAGVK